MSIAVSAAVIVSADPVALDADRPNPTTVFPITAPPDNSTEATTAEIGEVICRGTLAVRAHQQLRAGQRILVSGNLTPRPSLSISADCSGVILVIEATEIGIDLAPAAAPPPLVTPVSCRDLG